MVADNLDSVFPLPPLGSERSFNLDVQRLNDGAVAGELLAAKMRLTLEADCVAVLWLRRRIVLLEERRHELTRLRRKAS